MSPRDIGLADLARAIFPRDSKRRMVAVLTAYLDDSGTHDDSRVLLWGGLVALDETWGPFEAAWKAKLADPLPEAQKPPLRKFHMSNCEASYGEFEGYSPAERDAVIHDFRQIILDHPVQAYISGVSLRDWDQIIGRRRMRHFSDAEFFVLQGCLNSIAMYSRDRTENAPVALHLDDRKWPDAAIRTLVEAVVDHNVQREYAPVIHYGFSNSEAVVALQAADMVVWETYNYACHLLDGGSPEDVRPHLQRLIDGRKISASLADRNVLLTVKRMMDEEDAKAP